uniref:Apple domain-containing protein n=2 Tax=Quercus lobata TaxID=97700 RepID=A0A7N2L1P2_QUELO
MLMLLQSSSITLSMPRFSSKLRTTRLEKGSNHVSKTEGGCQRWNQSDCRHNGDKVDFKSGRFTNVDNLFHPRYYSIPDTNLAISDCKVSCWNNCSCVAFYYLYESATGCKFWTNMTNFIPEDSTGSERLYIITPETSNLANPNNTTPVPSNSTNPNNIAPKAS